ncbi:MAG: hypothetical protein ACOYXT_14485 [Bacteroidota bacterium]
MRLTKLAILVVLALSVSMTSYGQTKNDIFQKSTPITWLGLDFSGAKLIGDRERLGSESDVRHLLESWNNIILKEHEKYDIGLAIDKLKVTNAIEATTEHNANLDVLEMYSGDIKDYFHLKPEDVERIVADYDFKGYDGIGLMFVVESFSKLNEEGAVWVTFINMSTKEVFFTERMTAKPGGFGMRNFWAGAIYGILKSMQKKEFEMWRKKYAR